MKIAYFVLPLLYVCSSACSNKPIFPVEPHITYLDIQPRKVHQNQDFIYIKFHFEDGDGDLGDIDGGDTFSLLAIDNRPPYADTALYFKLPELDITTKNPSIQGELTLEYPPTLLRPGYLKDSTTYTVYILDRAGHKSNAIVTDMIYIEP